MESESPTIVVTGDVCIDWLQWPTKPEDAGLNWKLYAGTRMTAKPGGALLLADFMRTATGITVFSPQLNKIDKIPPKVLLHSNAELELFPYSTDRRGVDKDRMVYRINRCRGFTGPTTDSQAPLSFDDDDPRANMVVLDDAGNGFRDDETRWPLAIRDEEENPIVVYKMHRPLTSGDLWEHVSRNHSEKLVVVVTADDLRASSMNISSSLSWERTAKEFVWQMAYNKGLGLSDCTNLVVRFGLEGAIHYTLVGDHAISRLYFDPTISEGDFTHNYPGKMQGISSVFVAALAARIAVQCDQEDLLPDAVGKAVRDGLNASRELVRRGFGNDKLKREPEYPYPVAGIFLASEQSGDHIADVAISDQNMAEDADPHSWCILKEINDPVLEHIAYGIVRDGETAALNNVPIGNFGKLKSVDRNEIESFHSIRNLMRDYIESESYTRPLSIAVFGSPGSGKSFGITEIAKSVASGRVEILKFNLSQFDSKSDLISAFHKVRDLALEGKIPLVFFDEFDSDFNGKLGWLKYFLEPMQDGRFMERETMHPIGRSIFVFAGGINNTFERFSGGGADDAATMSSEEKKTYNDVKGPDFTSRLRGYVNIRGPNQRGSDDTVFVIRRAMLLRSLLEQKVDNLFDSTKHLRIDDGVLRALINVKSYKHGTRSIEAIIEMSMLNGRRSWEQAYLPAKEQLKLHLDEESFSRLLVSDVILGASRERLAEAIHEKYLADQKDRKAAADPSMQPWAELDSGLKESNRKQADQIQEKLRRVHYGLQPVVEVGAILYEFTPEEVEILAEMEHERWVSERSADGFVGDGTRVVDEKTSPHLLPWGELTEEVKEYDRETVRGIPEFLAKARFEVYRMD
ncbi:MAG: RyR domain-containing protein [Euryarchaeota archaeon]|nr:RyR domain-containing protein [Euryarchaeota archaeon]